MLLEGSVSIVGKWDTPGPSVQSRLRDSTREGEDPAGGVSGPNPELPNLPVWAEALIPKLPQLPEWPLGKLMEEALPEETADLVERVSLPQRDEAKEARGPRDCTK